MAGKWPANSLEPVRKRAATNSLIRHPPLLAEAPILQGADELGDTKCRTAHSIFYHEVTQLGLMEPLIVFVSLNAGGAYVTELPSTGVGVRAINIMSSISGPKIKSILKYHSNIKRVYFYFILLMGERGNASCTVTH